MDHDRDYDSDASDHGTLPPDDEPPLSLIEFRNRQGTEVEPSSDKLKVKIEPRPVVRSTYSAELFDTNGNQLLPVVACGEPISATVSLHLEHHMPHVQIQARCLPGKDTEHSLTSELLELSRKNTSNSGPQAAVESNKELFRPVVGVSINYASHQAVDSIDFGDDYYTRGEAAIHARKIPATIAERIRQLHKRGKRPLYVEFRFNISEALCQLVSEHTPDWAELFASSLRSGRVIAVMEAKVLTREQLKQLTDSFHHCKQHGSPLRRFHSRREFVYSMDKMTVDAWNYVTSYGYQAKVQMWNLDELNTVMAQTTKDESKVLRKQADTLFESDEPHMMRFVELHPDNNREYLAFVPLARGEGFLHKHKGIVEVYFDKDMQTEEIWHGRVVPDRFSFAPAGFLTLLVEREWLGQSGKPSLPRHFDSIFNRVAMEMEEDTASRATAQFSTHQIHEISLTGRSWSEITQLIKDDGGNPVALHMEPNLQMQNIVTKAVQELARDDSDLVWRQNGKIIRVCNGFERCIEHDVLTAIRAKFPEPEKQMCLNREQMDAVKAMQFAPDRHSLIQAPSGAGKTYLAGEIARLFFQLGTHEKIILISPTNASADESASRLEAILKQLKDEGLCQATRYGLRIHTISSERAILFRNAPLFLKAQPGGRPKTIADDLVVDLLDEVHQDLVRLYHEEQILMHTGVHDKRVKLIDQSLGHKMLEIAGIIKGPNTEPNEQRYCDFRYLYKYLDREDICDRKELEYAIADLLTNTIKGAAYIAGTTASVSQDSVLEHCLTDTRLLLLDQAAYQREDQLLPLYAAKFENIDGFIQLGDWRQLQPLVTIKSKENLFASQMGLSLFHRMIFAGFCVHQLTRSYQYQPQIADFLNKVAYKGVIKVENPEYLEKRRVALHMRRIAKKFTSKESNLLFMNQPTCKADETRMTSTSSRFNDLAVINIGNLVQDIVKKHPQATVCIATAYEAQYRRHLAAHAGMKRNEESSYGMHRVSIKTFDKLHGEKYDIVIADVLVSHQTPSIGVQDDNHCLTALVSRAQNGFILVGNRSAIKNAKGGQGGMLGRMLEHLKPFTHSMKKLDNLPDCPWYHPTAESVSD